MVIEYQQLDDLADHLINFGPDAGDSSYQPHQGSSTVESMN